MSPLITASPLAGKVLGSIEDNFVIAEWQDPGGPPGPPRLIAPLHVHHAEDEAWYVLEGTLHVRVADDEVIVRAGSSVLVPRGTPHTYWNPDAPRTRYLLVMTAKIYSMIHQLHQLKDRSKPLLQELFRRHDSELLG